MRITRRADVVVDVREPGDGRMSLWAWRWRVRDPGTPMTLEEATLAALIRVERRLNWCVVTTVVLTVIVIVATLLR